VFALCLVATVSAATPVRVAVMPFQLTQVSDELAGYAEDRLATELAHSGFAVTTPSELQAVIGLERQKQLLGCSDDRSCIAEISAALGVEFILVGRLTRLGKRFEVDLRLVRQKDASVAARDARGIDDEARLGELLAQSARALSEQVTAAEPAKPFAWRLWVPVVTGGVLLAVSASFWFLAERSYAGWVTQGSGSGPLLAAQVAPTFQSLALQRNLAIAGTCVGAALIASGFVWNALVPVVVPTADGAAVSLGGRW
jgi:TolB-like protein